MSNKKTDTLFTPAVLKELADREAQIAAGQGIEIEDIQQLRQALAVRTPQSQRHNTRG